MYPTFTDNLFIVGKANESISPAKKSMYAKHLKRLNNDWQPYNYLNYAFVPQSRESMTNGMAIKLRFVCS